MSSATVRAIEFVFSCLFFFFLVGEGQKYNSLGMTGFDQKYKISSVQLGNDALEVGFFALTMRQSLNRGGFMEGAGYLGSTEVEMKNLVVV